MLSISDAISKYSGDDDAYALKLKTGIRDAMGYSNYQAKLKGAVEAPISTGDVSKMDPATIARHRASKMGIAQGEIDNLGKITDAIDTTAGGLASAQAAREKAAAKAKEDAAGLDNNVAFAPEDTLDEEILAYKQNPKNPDGTIKSLQQFEAELVAKYGKEAMKGQFSADGQSLSAGANVGQSQEDVAAMINERIKNRVEPDFIGNEDKYSLMSQGYSEKQATEFQGALRYDNMSAPEKLIYQVTNPAMAKNLEEGKISKELISEIGTTTIDGQLVPKTSYETLVGNYPGTPEAEIKKLVAPSYKKVLEDDTSTWFNDNKKVILESLEDKDVGFNGLTGNNLYKNFKKELDQEFGVVFNSAEIERIIYNVISNGF